MVAKENQVSNGWKIILEVKIEKTYMCQMVVKIL